jgi:hypothetical protein
VTPPRFVVLRSLDDLREVAAGWPFATVESVALSVTSNVPDLAAACARAKRLCPDRPAIVLPMETALIHVRALRRALDNKARAKRRRFPRSEPRP